MNSYDNGRGMIYNGIRIDKGKKYPLSFVLDKVDNPDMVKFSARIMNNAGLPDSLGRAEIRVDETFHAICSYGKNIEKVANFICREAGYNYG